MIKTVLFLPPLKLSAPLLVPTPGNQTPFTMIKKLLTLSALVILACGAYQMTDQKADAENAITISRFEPVLIAKAAVRQMVKATSFH